MSQIKDSSGVMQYRYSYGCIDMIQPASRQTVSPHAKLLTRTLEPGRLQTRDGCLVSAIVPEARTLTLCSF